MHVPNCIMTVLYVFNFMCFLMVFMSLASVILGNNFLNTYQDIMLPLLPVSILYGTVSFCYHLYTCLILQLTLTDFMFICTESIPTVSISPLLYSWDISCSISFITLHLLLQQTFLKCPILPHLAMCYALSQLVYSPTISTQLPLQCLVNWSSSGVFLCPL